MNLFMKTRQTFLIQNELEEIRLKMNELRETIRVSEGELAEIEKEIIHLKHDYEAAQKELAQCRHEISVIDGEVRNLRKFLSALDFNKTKGTVFLRSIQINALRLSQVIDDCEETFDENVANNFLKDVPIEKYDRADLDVYTMKDLVAATLERENELKQTHCNLTAIGEHRRAVI